MAKTVFQLEAADAKAVQGFLRVLDAQKKVERQTKKNNRSFKRTGNTASRSMNQAAASVRNFVAGFASIGGIVMTVKNLVDQMKEIVNLRAEMFASAVNVEKLVQPLAHVRGNVTQKGLSSAAKDVSRLSGKTGVSMEVAEDILFFAESQFGNKTKQQRKTSASAALNIAKFAAPAGLIPEDIKQVSKLFDQIGADTVKKQKEALDKLVKTTKESSATVGEFTQELVPLVVSNKLRGFSYEQSLARLSGVIMSTGTVAEAGTAANAATEIAMGKTKKALKFYNQEARKRGIDYKNMPRTERYEFARKLYNEVREMNDPAILDKFIIAVGGKGMKNLRAMFSNTTEKKYREMLKVLGNTSEYYGTVDRNAESFKTGLTFQETRLKTSKRMAGYRTGGKVATRATLNEMTNEVFKQSHANIDSFGGFMSAALRPNFLEKKRIKQRIVEENLALGAVRHPEQLKMYQDLFAQAKAENFALNPEMVERIGKVTDQFGLIGGMGRRPTMKEIAKVRYDADYVPSDMKFEWRSGLVNSGFESYFGITSNDTKDLSESLKETTKAVNKLAVAIDSNSTIKPPVDIEE